MEAGLKDVKIKNHFKLYKFRETVRHAKQPFEGLFRKDML